MKLCLLSTVLLGACSVSGVSNSESPMVKSWIDQLPDVREFTRVTQSLAALDAVLSPHLEYRYYSFNAAWGDGGMMASMRDGSGDHWFAWIASTGVALHGLAHESSSFTPGKPKPWVFKDLPPVFHAGFLKEPAFDTTNSTYCLWRSAHDTQWRRGSVPLDDGEDGAREHMEVLLAGPGGYRAWAEGYYEVALSLADVEAVFRHEPLTDALAKRLNPKVDMPALRVSLKEIGYP
jgi:hypothetical protein